MSDFTVGRVTFGPAPEERATSLLKEDDIFEFAFPTQRKDAARLIAKQIEKAEQAAAEKARQEEREACLATVYAARIQATQQPLRGGLIDIVRDCIASAIRARSDKPESEG